MRNPLNRSKEVNPEFHRAQEGLRNVTRVVLAASLAHEDLQDTRDLIEASPNVITLNGRRNEPIDSTLELNYVDALAYLDRADQIASFRSTIHLIPIEPSSFVIMYDQDAEVS